MYVYELLSEILLAVPRAPVGDFRPRVNEYVRRIWESYRWPFYVSQATVSSAHTFSNLSTLPGGSNTTQVTDDGANGYFDDLHVGKTLTIAGTRYTIATVQSSDVVEVTPELDVDTGLAGSLPRVLYSPGATFSRLYGKPYRSVEVYPDRYMDAYSLEDPRDYVLERVSGSWRLRFVRVLSEDWIVRWYRLPVDATGPSSTLDLPDDLEGCLYQGLLGHYLQRVDARGELELAQIQVRAREAKKEHERRLKEARKIAGTVGERVAMNKPWGFG